MAELGGAEGSPPWREPIDEAAIRAYRLARTRLLIAEHDVAAVVVFDPVNLRYVTGVRNMQVWSMHNFCRYGLVAADGPSILFELPSARHNWRGHDTVDEVRPSLSADYLMAGPRGDELWAFLGAFYNTQKRVHTRAYTLDEAAGRWQPRGVVVGGGFWPMTEPVKMKNGNWIMPGFIVGNGNPAAKRAA